jgi:hypothetical protein
MRNYKGKNSELEAMALKSILNETSRIEKKRERKVQWTVKVLYSVQYICN